MKTVFGPVPTRRLGQSLGIDTIPLKSCNWNCVYCQLGRTREMVFERQVFIEADVVISDVEKSLQSHRPGEIDWITFVGSGETTLDTNLGSLIRAVKSLSQLPVAVITNGSFLYLPEVREELAAADAVLPSLDAGNAKLYHKINRAHPQFTFETLLEGLKAFREVYTGKYWIEVMLVQGMNDTEEALREISKHLHEIQPDEIHILQPTRPPVETWVQPPDAEGLMRARAILGDRARVIDSAAGSFDLSGEENLLDAIVGIITRHPMRESELVETLKKWSPADIANTLEDLQNSAKAQVVIRYGVRFWSAAPSVYPSSSDQGV